VAQRALALEAVGPVLLVDDPPPFADTDLSVEQVLLAAEALAEQGEALVALELLDQVLADRPDDPDLHAGRGWLMARLPSGELQVIGLESLDEALRLDAAHPEALVYRAFLRFELGDVDGARVDLAAFDELVDQPDELVALITAAALRDALA
jgi:cytochrome c-type biogenesis protein CcmH/NrfG